VPIPHHRIQVLTGQEAPNTSITLEYPSAEGDPYYPIPREENQVLYKKYAALAAAQEDVSFVGRLATYRYYNMDQVVGQALALPPLMERATRTGVASSVRQTVRAHSRLTA
jgi:UDP-galactopyranose mutase